MHRSAAALALVSLLAATPACTMQRRTGHTLTAVGGAMTAAGAYLTGRAVVDYATLPFVSDDKLDHDLRWGLVGALVLVTGLVVFTSGVTAHEPWRPSEKVTLEVPTGSPSGAYGGPEDLPAIAATPEVVRMGKQVRSAVLRNECDAAWRTLATIDASDATYAAVLASSSVMRGCER